MNKWGNQSLAKELLSVQNSYQLTALKESLDYLLRKSPFYKNTLKALKPSIENLESLADLSLLPTSSKEDLQLNNWDFLCVPKSEIAEYTSSSGTLGEPVTIALTENDLKRLAYNEFCSFQMMDLSEEDIVQLMLTLDKQFMAGMAYYRGAEAIGAARVRTGPGAPLEQLKTIQKLKSTALVAVPSFLIKIAEAADQNQIKLTELSIKKALGIGESMFDEHFQPNALFKRIEGAWPIEVFSTYASTEMQTAFTSCSQKNGLHLNPELLIVELLDEAGSPVMVGEIGEVTITTLGVEAMPLLRFRTGDLCKIDKSPCACGRNSPRLSGVLGRKHQMIKFKGTSVYPAAIFELLNQETWIDNYLIGLYSDEQDLDLISIKVSTKNPNSVPLIQKLKVKFSNQLRVVPNLELIDASGLSALQFPNGGRKQLKIIDYRQK